MAALRTTLVTGAACVLLAGAVIAAGGPADAATATPRCGAAATQVTTEWLHPGAGLHFGVKLHVTNTSGAPCVVNGYPTVTLPRTHGRSAVTATDTVEGYLATAAPVRTVLAPGAVATAVVEGVAAPDPDSASYPRSASATMTLPGITYGTRVALQVSMDPGLEVHGLVPGTSGGANAG